MLASLLFSDEDPMTIQSQALILETGISRTAHAPGASRGVPTPNEPGCASPHRDEAS